MIKKFVIILINTVILSGLFISCKKTRQLPDPLEAGWEGNKVCEVVFEDEQLRVLRCTFAPGIGHEKHYHIAHFGYTLSGSRLQITDDTGAREIEVPTGSDFNSNGIEWHEVLNIGDSTAVFLIIEPK